jgi:hypothetical protein
MGIGRFAVPLLASLVVASVLSTVFLAFSVHSFHPQPSDPYHVLSTPAFRVLRYSIDPNSPSASIHDAPPWPPMKVFVYPESPYHTSDCLYPPELPNRYVNTTGYWWQRMLEPVVHHQFLHSPVLSSDPSSASLFIVPHYSRMCSGLDSGERWNAIPSYVGAHGNMK